MENNLFHSKPAEKVLKELSSHLEGLSLKEAESRLEKFGPNEIPEKKAVHPVFLFLKQFRSWLIYVLIGAAIFSWWTKHFFDFYIILAVLLFNAIMGFIQEYKAEKAIAALRKMVVDFTKGVRGGDLLNIPVKELVPGDIILVEGGDRIPADARLLEIKNLRTMEASLTGESIPVDKELKELPENTPLADQENMIWLGTFVSSGQAKAVVTATGLNTALGKIAQSLEEIKPPKTHFRRKTDFLAKQMAALAFIGASSAFFIGFIFEHIEFEEMFHFAVASLVSGIPEGLPAVLVIVLAIGAHRMAKRNAIIRNLQATETLGVVNIIAADKTGTLTQNTMNAESVVLLDQEEIKITGDGWKPKGEFSQKGKTFFPLENIQLKKLLHICSVGNSARLIKEDGKKEGYKIIGDPTEGALVVLAEKAGIKKEILLEKEKVIDGMPFSSELKYAAFLIELPEKKEKQIYLVGAPEPILKVSIFGKEGEEKERGLKEKEKKEILKKVEGLAKKGLRVLVLAYKKVPLTTEKLSEDLIKDFIFVGMVGMKDPLRPEAKESIAKAKRAGIKIIMKTGDHKETALAIAKEVGLITEKEEKGKYPLALTERDLEKLSEKEFNEIVDNVPVFARLTPQMKLRILESLQKKGYIVAMTGDGVNDALALKRADVGIAMGEIGTDVARESSDMVLADDNFASIINAVEEGRTVFTNVRQTSCFLITTSFAEDITLLISLIFGYYLWGQTTLILLPAAIIFMNLVTDGFADVALAAEPSHEDVLDGPPRKKEENIISREFLPFLSLMVATMAILTIAVFKVFFIKGCLEKARAGAFAVMAITQLFNVLNMRSFTQSVFKIGFFSNKFLVIGLAISFFLTLGALFIEPIAVRFGFAVLSPSEFLIILLLSSSVFWLGELYKYLKRKKSAIRQLAERKK